MSAAKALKGNSSHTISLRQTECQKTGQTITAAVYEYLVDNDGEWGKLRFDFENGTAEIVKLADWDTVKSNVLQSSDSLCSGLTRDKIVARGRCIGPLCVGCKEISKTF